MGEAINVQKETQGTGYIYNILSIDFDIIMYPCIRLYNNYIGGDQNPTEIWKYLEHEYEITNHLSYDAKALELLFKVLKKAVLIDKARLVSMSEHQMIVDDLRKDSNYDTNLYNVYNIDWHHDIFYNKEDEAISKYFDKYSCADWVGYLYKTNKLAKYIWYNAPNSSNFPTGAVKQEDIEKDMFKVRNINNEDHIADLLDTAFNIVYLVESPQWVPYKFHHLFNILSEVYKL